MSTLHDKTGAEVTVAKAQDGRSFDIKIAGDSAPAGNAYYLDRENPGTGPESDPGREHPTAERIFYHTIVDEAYGGRGLASILAAEALAATRQEQRTVVPSCPFIAGYLSKHGEDYVAGGGKFRPVTSADNRYVREHYQD